MISDDRTGVTADTEAFPFGRPNTERPLRAARVGRAQALIVGVYPSALHVRWTAPTFVENPRGRGGIASMAIDVEPTVFWDGDPDAWSRLLREWKLAVGFREGDDRGQHGRLGKKPPASNGASGKKLVSRYLRRLALDADAVAFTDVYPVYMMKRGSKTSRGQLDAVEQDYNPIAGAMKFRSATIPVRIPADKLPAVAADRFGFQLRADLVETAAPLVITLGEEPWLTLERVHGIELRPPVTHFCALYPQHYGRIGTISVGSYTADWLPLVHPGLISTRGDPDRSMSAQRPGTGDWDTLHSRWEHDAARS